MNTLFSPYSATPAGRRRRQHIREQLRHAHTRRRSSTLSRVLDGAQEGRTTTSREMASCAETTRKAEWRHQVAFYSVFPSTSSTVTCKLKKNHISKKTHWVRSTKCEKGLRPFLNQSVKIGLLIGPQTVVFGLSIPPFQVVRKGPTIFTNLNWKIGQHFCPPLWKLLSIHSWMPAISTDNMPPWLCMVSGRI